MTRVIRTMTPEEEQAVVTNPASFAARHVDYSGPSRSRPKQPVPVPRRKPLFVTEDEIDCYWDKHPHLTWEQAKKAILKGRL